MKALRLRALFLAGEQLAAPTFKGCDCSPCGNIILWRMPFKSVQRRGESKEGRRPLLCRFKGGVQGRGNRNPLPWRAFSFCPLSLCTSKEKMDTRQSRLRREKGRSKLLPYGAEKAALRNSKSQKPIPPTPAAKTRSRSSSVGRSRTAPRAAASAARPPAS